MEAVPITGPKADPSVQRVKTGDIQEEGRHAEQYGAKGSSRSMDGNLAAVLTDTPKDQAALDAEDPPAEVTKQILTADQRRIAAKLRNEFNRQVTVLQAIIQKQILLTGQDPISKDEAASKTVEKATASGAPIKANVEGPPEAVAGTSPAAKTSRLSPESEAVLLTLFALQDLLGREDAQVLASQAGCSESQVREYFTKLRSNVRSFMQRLQRKATSAEAPFAGATNLHTAAPTAPQQPPPASGGGPSSGGSLQSQPTIPQSAAATSAQLAAASAGPQPPQAAAGVPLSQAAPAARPASAGPAQGSPMTAMDLRTLLASVATAQVTLQQSPASTPSAPDTGEADAAAMAGPSMDELASIDAARQAGLAELQRYLDAAGGIASAKHAGPVASLMARAASAEVREALLQALLRTGSSQVLGQLASSGRALDTLDGWARWAEMDRQSTVLRLLLGVLQRLPMPTALIRGSGLQRTIARLQKYRTPGIAAAATALLQQWYHLEQPGLAAAHAPAAPPAPPPVRVAAQPQGGGRGPAHSAAPQMLPSVQLLVFKPGQQVPAGPQMPQRSAPAAAPAPMSFQPSQGQAELLKPGNSFYRGISCRLGSMEKAEQPQSPRKVLSADEIVRAKEKERSRLASAAGLGGRPGPAKSSRLDANTLMDFANRRANPRPALPLLHSQGRPTNAALPHLQSSAVVRQPQQQQQPRPWQAQQQSQRPTVTPAAAAVPRNSQQQRPQQAVRAPSQQPQPQPAAVLRPSVPWVAPKLVAQPSPRERPSSGEESEEAANQRARNLLQPGVAYEGLDKIPSSPAEPEEGQPEPVFQPPTKVPVLPTDPQERVQQLQALQMVGVPVETLLRLQ